MTIRFRRKKNKLRGGRFHGQGNTKNKRGAGTRGGRGRAGSKKHKRFSFLHEIGNKIKLKPKKDKTITINLGKLNEKIPEWEKKGLVEKNGKDLIIDGIKVNVQKVLGKGSIEKKIIFKNIIISKNALKKIEKAGGKIIE